MAYQKFIKIFLFVFFHFFFLLQGQMDQYSMKDILCYKYKNFKNHFVFFFLILIFEAHINLIFKFHK